MRIENNKLQELLPVFSRISQLSFWLALFIELTIVIVEKSEYLIRYEGWWFRLTFLLCVISLLTLKHSKKEWVFLFLFGIIGLISYKATGRNELLRWIVFIWACKGKDMKKVFQFSFWYVAAGSLLLILLSVLGIYGSIYQTGVFRYEMEETRYCFGMGHPNSFHCMMLVITWLGIYCYHEKLKWWGYGLITIAHGLLFYFTVSRTGLLMSAGTMLAVVAVKYLPKIKEGRLPYLLGIGTIASAVLFSVFMAKNSIYHPLLAKLDVYLSGRIVDLINTMDSEGMLHTWSLWSVKDNIYYFDLGIVRMFYWFGIIPAVIYYVMQCLLVWCGYKKRDYMMAVIMICITIYSIFEAHFISVYLGRNFILFWFGMYLTQMLGEEKRSVTKIENKE